MENPNQKVSDWLESRAESEGTKRLYLWSWNIFNEFCAQRGKNLKTLVTDYRATKYAGELQREEFLEEWQDTLRAYTPWLNNAQTPQKAKRFAPLSVKDHLSTAKSFISYWKIPLDVDLPKHACVIYHNRDLKKEEFKQILTFASPRDRVIYLILGESGMRVENVVNLKYWQIKDDFEAKRVPMKILLPSSTLKDHVGDRWTFIGEDGFTALSDYLARRTPKDEEYVFKSEKQGKVRGEQFSTASVSTKFNRIVQKLNIAPSLAQGKGKPKKIRLHGLRKYFRNNMKADSAFVNFWMGHSLGVDAHYISRDPEDHRQRYAEGYKSLRILEASQQSITQLYEITLEKDRQIKELEKTVKLLQDQVEQQKGMQGQINKMWAMLEQVMKGKGDFHIEPITEETAIKELLTTPEKNQIDLTENSKNLKLRKNLLTQDDKSKPKN